MVLVRFRTLPDLTDLHNVVKSYPVKIARRNLFSQNSLLNMDMNIRRLDSWQVAFQLEALVRNLSIDPKEVDVLVPKIRELMKSHGKPFTAKLLKDFWSSGEGLSPDWSIIYSYI